MLRYQNSWIAVSRFEHLSQQELPALMTMKYQRLFQREPSLDSNVSGANEEKRDADEDSSIESNGVDYTIYKRRAHVSSFWLISGWIVAAFLAVCLVFQRSHNDLDYPSRDPTPGLKVPNPSIPGLNPGIRSRTLPITDWPEHPPSLYRQPPSAAVDTEWNRISNVHNIALTSAQVASLGKDPSSTVKVPPEWGLGDDTHLGLITVLHQTHCLNKLRQAVYYDHYFRREKGWGRLPPDEERSRYFTHLDHCLHFLLETVTCVADTSVTTYHWMENRTLPVADFQANGQCRDFEQLVDWHSKNHIDAKVSQAEEEARWATFRPREGDVVLPRIPATENEFWDKAIGVEEDSPPRCSGAAEHS